MWLGTVLLTPGHVPKEGVFLPHWQREALISEAGINSEVAGAGVNHFPGCEKRKGKRGWLQPIFHWWLFPFLAFCHSSLGLLVPIRCMRLRSFAQARRARQATRSWAFPEVRGLLPIVQLLPCQDAEPFFSPVPLPFDWPLKPLGQLGRVLCCLLMVSDGHKPLFSPLWISHHPISLPINKFVPLQRLPAKSIWIPASIYQILTASSVLFLLTFDQIFTVSNPALFLIMEAHSEAAEKKGLAERNYFIWQQKNWAPQHLPKMHISGIVGGFSMRTLDELFSKSGGPPGPPWPEWSLAGGFLMAKCLASGPPGSVSKSLSLVLVLEFCSYSPTRIFWKLVIHLTPESAFSGFQKFVRHVLFL